MAADTALARSRVAVAPRPRLPAVCPILPEADDTVSITELIAPSNCAVLALKAATRRSITCIASFMVRLAISSDPRRPCGRMWR